MNKTPHSRTFVNLKVWKETHELLKALAQLHNRNICAFVHELAVDSGVQSVQTETLTNREVSVQTEAMITKGA